MNIRVSLTFKQKIIFLDFIHLFKSFFFGGFILVQRESLLKRHKATEKACETKPHHLPIVQAANKRELDVCIYLPIRY